MIQLKKTIQKVYKETDCDSAGIKQQNRFTQSKLNW